MAAPPVPLSTTTEPTTAQRKMLAKMGLAMPDGSFYIRNGPVGASDLENAIKAVGRGEQDGSSGNPIRKHIMKRAAALKLSDKIPDTWNSDGSLKHDAWIAEVEDYLEHYGVKGMHWGVRKSAEHQAARTEQRIARTKSNIQYRKTAISNIKSHIADAEKNGSDAELFKKQYGVHSNAVFQAIHGKSRSQALEEHKAALHREIEDYHRPALYALQGHLSSLERKQAKAQHDAIADEDDEFLAHYGVKGMQWRSTAQRQAAEATATAAGQKGVQAAKKANASKKADKHQLHLLHLAHLLKLSKDMAGKHAANVKHLKATGQHSKISAASAAHAKAQAQLAARAKLVAQAAAHGVFDDPDFIEHFGIKGQKWGVRRPRGTASDNPSSSDAARAKATRDTISKHGIGAVSTADLQHLVSRQNLETQYGKLTEAHGNAGRKAVQGILVQVGKQQASALATKAVTEGLKRLTEAKS